MAKKTFSIKCKGTLDMDNGITITEVNKDEVTIVNLLAELQLLAGEELNISITKEEKLGTPDEEVDE